MIIGDHLYCANVGDSKGYLYSGNGHMTVGVICEGASPLLMTKDHVASDEEERERITKAGGVVVW
jgi:serine/threonine protein phosphatase PrpC